MRVAGVENEPLYHFHPGARVLRPGFLTPSSVVDEALRGGAQCVTLPGDPGPHTTNVLAALWSCRDWGLFTIGAITAHAASEGRGVDLAELDAVTVDLTAAMEVSRLRATLKRLRKIAEGVKTWMELVVRVVPGQTGSHRQIEAVSRAIKDALGPDVPVHFDRLCGPAETPTYTRWIAASSGLRWVYTDSADDAVGRSTWCPGCDAQLVARGGASTVLVCLSDGVCSSCGRPVPGRFVRSPVAKHRASDAG